MILLGIFLAVSLLAAILLAWDDWQPVDTGMGVFLIGAGLSLPSWLLIGAIGDGINTHESIRTGSAKIVSLRDGSQINGNLSGGLFLVRGQIGEKEVFSYYQDAGPNTFTLEKQPADLSTIVQDAEPTSASVEWTHKFYECKAGWWYFCIPKEPEFQSATFHVPPNSIKQDFVLDAN